MIDYVSGVIADLTPTTAVVECGGVGFALCISLNTFTALQGKKETKLYVHESIREDAYTLYGFAAKQERALFELLISVSGIGGNTARMILSAFTPSELVDVVSSGNEKMLKTVKGIGLKTAQRIIVDLKDKILTASASGAAVPENRTRTEHAETLEEATAALTMLGFAGAASFKAVQAVLKEEPEASVERVIKLALKRL